MDHKLVLDNPPVGGHLINELFQFQSDLTKANIIECPPVSLLSLRELRSANKSLPFHPLHASNSSVPVGGCNHIQA
jgi:hypothetical protein